MYKGIYLGKSKGVFNGKIMVRPDAQKINAFQANNNLLLSDDSSINSKPQLEIYADDVKCSHGCTIGQLDENALFYLRTRGISKEDANAILTFAFASEAMDKISIPVLGDHVKSLMEDKLGVNLRYLIQMKMIDPKKSFPILDTIVNENKLVYFDNAATTQKHHSVVDEITKFYNKENSNIHRGVHYLSQLSTKKFEESRAAVRNFINAKHNHEIIFTKGTTDSINLLASCYSKILKSGDEIIISEMEHHSNIVPWQMCCENTGAKLKIIPITELGELDLNEFKNLVSSKTKLVSITHISNSLGTINPIEKIINLSHENGAKVLIDGAQAAAHVNVDVQDLNVDYYCFSAHKLYGPTGVGVLYGKEDLLNYLPPYQGGGEMIQEEHLKKMYLCLFTA